MTEQIRLGRIIQWMTELAPEHLAEDWDSVGLQVGEPDTPVSRVMTALTVTEDVIEQGRARGVQLIVAHHPVLFGSVKSLSTNTRVGRLLTMLIRADIALYVSHTNLDTAYGGVNDTLSKRLSLLDVTPFFANEIDNGGKPHLGRIGRLPQPMDADSFINHVKTSLDVKDCRPAGARPDGLIERVAVIGGSGGSFINDAAACGADAFVTGDIDYHDADEARFLGLHMVDAGHFGTEKHVPLELATYLRRRAIEDSVAFEVMTAEEQDAFL